jgi:hypothetical protein
MRPIRTLAHRPAAGQPGPDRVSDQPGRRAHHPHSTTSGQHRSSRNQHPSRHQFDHGATLDRADHPGSVCAGVQSWGTGPKQVVASPVTAEIYQVRAASHQDCDRVVFDLNGWAGSATWSAMSRRCMPTLRTGESRWPALPPSRSRSGRRTSASRATRPGGRLGSWDSGWPAAGRRCGRCACGWPICGPERCRRGFRGPGSPGPALLV